MSDEDGYVIFETELEAQKDIVDNMMIGLEQFMEGEREFMDAITADEYVVPVTVRPDSVIIDGCVRFFWSTRGVITLRRGGLLASSESTFIHVRQRLNSFHVRCLFESRTGA